VSWFIRTEGAPTPRIGSFSRIAVGRLLPAPPTDPYSERFNSYGSFHWVKRSASVTAVYLSPPPIALILADPALKVRRKTIGGRDSLGVPFPSLDSVRRTAAFVRPGRRLLRTHSSHSHPGVYTPLPLASVACGVVIPPTWPTFGDAKRLIITAGPRHYRPELCTKIPSSPTPSMILSPPFACRRPPPPPQTPGCVGDGGGLFFFPGKKPDPLAREYRCDLSFLRVGLLY